MLSTYNSKAGLLGGSRLLKKAYIIFLLFLTGCFSDAPRDNPLDSQNGSSITGQVVTSVGGSGIAGAQLTIQPLGLGAVSDADGFFAILNVSEGSYSLTSKSTGYAELEQNINAIEGVSITIAMNALPVLSTASLKTRHISRFFPAEDEFYIDLELEGIDPEQPDSSLTGWYEIPSFAFVDTLRSNMLSKDRFTSRLDATDIGIRSIRSLIGKPFNFFLRDPDGNVTTSEDKFIQRIIDLTPVPIQPIADDVVGMPFMLEWELVTQLVDFTYKVEIYQIQIDTTLLLVELDGFRPGTTGYTYSLPNDPDVQALEA
ncbi:MAG: carboxypeptidase-like regulatory domain-containing protein, partial [Calditrichota bacterium]